MELVLNRLPEEVTDYVFDQLEDRLTSDGLAVAMQDIEMSVDYEGQEITTEASVIGRVVINTALEKIRDIEWEIEHNERDDFTLEEMQQARDTLRLAERGIRDRETYTKINVRCPVCGSTDVDHTEEDIPNGFSRHYVHPTCGNCKTTYTVEMVAIDVSFQDAGHEAHSGVSQMGVTTNEHEYATAEEYAKVPEVDLQSLNWPLECDECGEVLRGNNLLSPEYESDQVSEEALETKAVFECPNCENHQVEEPEQ